VNVKFVPGVDDGYVVLEKVLDEVKKSYIDRAKKFARKHTQAANALGIKNYQTYLNWGGKPNKDPRS
jgi:hypothetical protein